MNYEDLIALQVILRDLNLEKLININKFQAKFNEEIMSNFFIKTKYKITITETRKILYHI